ncbi:ribosome-inactivating family protein [Streptomyces griseorubiginosus]|uniref:ribosome-inactivating family protein n=1 Tax=Streptomyces griseorubiginosus TaxID=67304 RepID=UPI00114037A8|nr:ribosome-inactivating family protein [Streptomyces griseorubiginosus]
MSRAHLFRRISTSAVLPAALASAVLVAGMGGNLTTGAQHTTLGANVRLANALVPTDGFSYDLTGLAGSNAANTYNQVIRDIRGRLRSGNQYGSIARTERGNDFFDVTFAVGQNSITLVFNARNLYVKGWRNNRTGQYVRLGDDAPQNLPGQNGATQNRNWLNYTDLERAGQVDRSTQGITMGSIQSAVSDLSGSNWRDQARALLVLVQAFAEGARYDFISYRIQQAMRNSGIWYSGTWDTVTSNGVDTFHVNGLALENNWESLSNAVQNYTDRHTPVNFAIGDGRFTTIGAIDAQLAVSLTRL